MPCIGDILDIPLQNQSVDMTIACDVMEHIEVDKLDKAVAELRRVSRKYIYIQVPHNEILRYGVPRTLDIQNSLHDIYPIHPFQFVHISGSFLYLENTSIYKCHIMKY